MAMLPPRLPTRKPQRKGQIPSEPDAAIRWTDDVALQDRLTANFFLDDPYVTQLAGGDTAAARRFAPGAERSMPSLENFDKMRGTYVRTRAIDRLVDRWLDNCERAGCKAQIVSLGAGSDTRFWRYGTDERYKDSLGAYIEVDFSETVTKKAEKVEGLKDQESATSVWTSDSVRKGQNDVLRFQAKASGSGSYYLLAADMRKPGDPEARSENPNDLFSQLHAILDVTLPTLLLSECVFVYMKPEESDALLAWFANKLGSTPLGGIVYEMFGLSSRGIGQTMARRLADGHGIALPGAYPDAHSLADRFTTHGFGNAYALTIDEIIKFKYIDLPESKLQAIPSFLRMGNVDEAPGMLLEKYAVTWGVKSGQGTAQRDLWSRWGYVEAMSSEWSTGDIHGEYQDSGEGSDGTVTGSG
ncbi:S-adenosyl-L-methionine-dependent methyltransferase [Coniophora puteana RWD-64-598 SS2]|uniref:Leucine carboxyl methyltransferase 1 n=1 Tax=Coniophora puteana (strain RWD-64-598) TaxID=741705 RepID=A0A5M3MMG1_CONPW|nr:S-adenosyl-L-methionine-dependent methyltransferase [Coniophora puteana RWD-64-598 SS2]EIW80369.1 S-adenosyl-L-methionine-dependent methyltransferase [Coniophora puteana RWD-64-598 SS2]